MENWYDSDGNYYGSWEDIEDAMVNENGVTDQDGNKYYWTAPHDASEEVTDPYDLYSWDPGTNCLYTQFQAAESDCSPIGRGNGWYYYDARQRRICSVVEYKKPEKKAGFETILMGFKNCLFLLYT